MKVIHGKALFFLLALSLSAMLFPGCAPQNDNKSSITVWHWMTDRQDAFQELAKKYTQETGVNIVLELYAPSDAYSQKVRAAAQGATLPDIFGVLVEKRDFAAFIKAGHILDLTSFMNESGGKWKNTFFPKALAVNEFSEGNTYGVTPGYYGVPIDVTTVQMLYNKNLFKTLGLDPEKPPVNFEQFLEIGRNIKAKKLQGLVSGWAEVWMINCMANNYAFNILGKDKFLATLKGEVPYTDPDWIRVFTLFKEMADSEVLAEGIVTMVNKTAEQLFATERAVFALNGSWAVNVYKGMNPGLQYAAMLPPAASGKYPMSIWGGAGSSFMVNARSARKDEAVKFLQWLTAKDQQAFLAEKTMNLPANRESLKSVPPELAQFAQGLEYSTHPNTWGISEYPEVTEALGKGIQSIIIGEKSPAEVASEVQRIKEKQAAKRRQ